MLAAFVWHWWIGVILFVATVAGIVALVVGYLKQVVAPQYPPRDQLRK
jgi:hypothetical protein